MGKVILNNKEFVTFIDPDEIKASVHILAEQINKDYRNKKPLFIGVLNGCFMFFSDLMKELDIECEVSFVKLSSYHNMQRSNIDELIGFNGDIEGRDVIVIEDIVDSGNTLEKIYSDLNKRKPKSLETATLLFKPEAYTKQIDIKYVAFEIPNRFVLGYGLDYNGIGRNLDSIYYTEEKE